jgi:hypothetical protein
MDRVQLDNDGDVRFINAQLSQHLQSVLEEVQPMIDIQLKSLSPEERVQHQTLIQQHLHEWIASVFECMTHNISIHGEPYDAHRVFPTTEPVEPFDATLYDAHIAHFQEYQTLEQILSKHRQQLPVHAAQVVQSTLDQERILLNDLLNSIIPDVVRANVNEKTAHEPLISEKMQADYASAMAQLVRLRRVSSCWINIDNLVVYMVVIHNDDVVLCCLRISN